MSELGLDTCTRHKDYSNIRRSAWKSGAQVSPRSGKLRQPVGEFHDDTMGSRRQDDGLPIEHEETSTEIIRWTANKFSTRVGRYWQVLRQSC
jgi:hypothetical protein